MKPSGIFHGQDFHVYFGGGQDSQSFGKSTFLAWIHLKVVSLQNWMCKSPVGAVGSCGSVKREFLGASRSFLWSFLSVYVCVNYRVALHAWPAWSKECILDYIDDIKVLGWYLGIIMDCDDFLSFQFSRLLNSNYHVETYKSLEILLLHNIYPLVN